MSEYSRVFRQLLLGEFPKSAVSLHLFLLHLELHLLFIAPASVLKECRGRNSAENDFVFYYSGRYRSRKGASVKPVQVFFGKMLIALQALFQDLKTQVIVEACKHIRVK